MQKSVAALVQGTVYSSLVGCSYKLFVDNDWDLKHLPKLVLFWAGFVVPSGVIWSRVNFQVFKMLGVKREIVWNLATFNKKALATDFVLNQILYQSIFVAAFYEYCKFTMPRSVKLVDPNAPIVQESENKQPPVILVPESEESRKEKNELLYGDNNLLYLTALRLKIAAGSYFLDMWGPWLTDAYLKNNRIKFFKDLIFSLTWNVNVLKKYYEPEPKKELFVTQKDSKN